MGIPHNILFHEMLRFMNPGRILAVFLRSSRRQRVSFPFVVLFAYSTCWSLSYPPDPFHYDGSSLRSVTWKASGLESWTLVVHVQNPQGEPVQGADVYVLPDMRPFDLLFPKTVARHGRTDEDGCVRFVSLQYLFGSTILCAFHGIPVANQYFGPHVPPAPGAFVEGEKPSCENLDTWKDGEFDSKGVARISFLLNIVPNHFKIGPRSSSQNKGPSFRDCFLLPYPYETESTVLLMAHHGPLIDLEDGLFQVVPRGFIDKPSGADVWLHRLKSLGDGKDGKEWSLELPIKPKGPYLAMEDARSYIHHFELASVDGEFQYDPTGHDIHFVSAFLADQGAVSRDYLGDLKIYVAGECWSGQMAIPLWECLRQGGSDLLIPRESEDPSFALYCLQDGSPFLSPCRTRFMKESRAFLVRVPHPVEISLHVTSENGSKIPVDRITLLPRGYWMVGDIAGDPASVSIQKPYAPRFLCPPGVQEIMVHGKGFLSQGIALTNDMFFSDESSAVEKSLVLQKSHNVMVRLFRNGKPIHSVAKIQAEPMGDRREGLGLWFSDAHGQCHVQVGNNTKGFIVSQFAEEDILFPWDGSSELQLDLDSADASDAQYRKK